MIKNDNQLVHCEKRLEEIRKEIREQETTASALNPAIFVIPMQIEEKELLTQIEEYRKLSSLDFQDAMLNVLSEPVLIDSIGELLAKIRLAAKHTQAEMADILGWEQSNLSRFESENYSSQTVSKIVEYASALGIWLHIRPSLSEELEPIIRTIFIKDLSCWEPDNRDLAITGSPSIGNTSFSSTNMEPCLEKQPEDVLMTNI